MLNIFICEDNNIQRSKIRKSIEKTLLIEALDMKIILDSPSPNEIISALEESQGSGLYFLDIDLNSNINGIKLAQLIRQIDPRGFIVFITSHSEMSMLTFSYKVEALDFILKDESDKIEEKIRECILKSNERYSSSNNTIHKNYVIKVNDKTIPVDYKDILYFETSNNIHKVNLHTMTKKIEFLGKLKDIEAVVDDRFYRCHRSFLINIDNIKLINVNARTVVMKNGIECLISVRQLKGLKTRLGKQ